MHTISEFLERCSYQNASHCSDCKHDGDVDGLHGPSVDDQLDLFFASKKGNMVPLFGCELAHLL